MASCVHGRLLKFGVSWGISEGTVRFKFRVNKVEKVLVLGVYPDVSLKLAREGRDQATATTADRFRSTRIDLQAARHRIGNVLLW
jgi:hypothetical protein